MTDRMRAVLARIKRGNLTWGDLIGDDKPAARELMKLGLVNDPGKIAQATRLTAVGDLK